MKQLLFLSIMLLSLLACKKEMAGAKIIVEPPLEKIISIDTLTRGQLFGLSIGESTTDIYSTLQNIKSEKFPNYLGVVGNVFTTLKGLKNKIPLYSSLYLDEATGTSSGIQFYFFENKVKSIWINNGKQLSKWPEVSPNNVSISVNDPVEGIYEKLVDIKKMNVYAKKFERISIFEKDLNKPYDSQMDSSPQWYFNSIVDHKTGSRLSLNFSEGKLISIYATLYEIQ